MTMQEPIGLVAFIIVTIVVLLGVRCQERGCDNGPDRGLRGVREAIKER
jgi:hypothetical protein